MEHKAGVFLAYKKDKTPYYRTSITYKGKHISLGSFSTENKAHQAYLEGKKLLENVKLTPSTYHSKHLSFDKCVILMNFRDHNIYFKTPIYMMKRYFLYYYDQNTVFTFDIDDLFFYASHKIMKRGRHLFVADYGMQVNILNRYGIRNFGVEGKDYYFANGDSNDFRSSNVICLNPYAGVRIQRQENGLLKYQAKIHINGDFLVGEYDSMIDAAIAYNKAVDVVKKQGINKNFEQNYIEGITQSKYADIYYQIKISTKLENLPTKYLSK